MYTGNTGSGNNLEITLPVYPCVYREHFTWLKNKIRQFGLSLCIQGTRFCRHFGRQSQRFIPVYTGNTNGCLQLFHWITVYPCVYREHWYSVFLRFTGWGLSLCIQGTQPRERPTSHQVRFIPVYTGNTRVMLIWFLKQPVYPCVYREHTFASNVGRTKGGLSLCIQGTPKKASIFLLQNRFIPVYTGNTSQFVTLELALPVYPCVYREHSKYI